MNFSEIGEIKLEGLEIISELRPEDIREHMSQFIEKSISVITERIDSGEKIDLVFPMNGAAMFMYLIKQRMPQHYIDQINWVSAFRPDKNDKLNYRFVHSKGNFIGTPVVIDDIWDSGDSTKYISDAIAKELSEERVSQLTEQYNEDGRYTRSSGAIPLAVLVASTKVGKVSNSAQYTFKMRNGKDNWIACAFGLNCGHGPVGTTRKERLSGVAYGVTDLSKYINTVNDIDGRNTYEDILEQSGREVYEDDYDRMMHILEVLDNEELPMDLRSLQIMIELGLITEG